MRSAFIQPSSDLGRVPITRRAATLSLVIALHALILLLLLRLAPTPEHPPEDPPGALTVELLPEAAVAPTPARTVSRNSGRRGGEAPRAPVPAPVPVPAAPAAPPSEAPSAVWSQVIPLTREQFAAADLSAMPAAPAGGADGGRGRGSGPGQDSGAADEGGGGPNGERLYNADWQRRPTHAELATYRPPGAPPTGWGMIACRTVPGNRVEDCVEIGQSPQGSGFARAVRQAAWQFRVRPPRIGGRPMVGAWVRIRIEYTERETG